MLEQEFIELYDKFKLNFYRNIFAGFTGREASLTATETFCVEVIHALKRPTVNKLAEFLDISQPNAAYKVASLVKKGYVIKTQSQDDKRVFYLEVTDKFDKYYKYKNEYTYTVLDRAKKEFSEEEVKSLENMLHRMSTEMMPEIAGFFIEEE